MIGDTLTKRCLLVLRFGLNLSLIFGRVDGRGQGVYNWPSKRED